MKRFLILSLLFVFTMGVSAQGVFGVGDKKVDFTIGVGKVRHIGATFDQHVNMEWGVAKIADKFTIGVGFSVNNTYGGKVVGAIAGEYDYTYNVSYRTSVRRNNRWIPGNETQQRKREGYGSATADIKREDFNAMAMVSFHYSPIKKLDTYARLGLGIGCKTYLFKNIRNEEDFNKADVKDKKIIENSERRSYMSYKYNDLDHVNWIGYKAKPVASMALYVGATYYITDNWGVDGQIGLISGNLRKKAYPNSLAVFAVGASYKF
ncbi:MAG: hypothetical protein IKB57_06195 [Bacteroidaceae bacterium]|nr:hypothetical protein [Bacteroidaceae bacterium]